MSLLLRRKVLLALVAAACLGGLTIWFLVSLFVQINRQIDRCDDPSSGAYISNRAERDLSCARN